MPRRMHEMLHRVHRHRRYRVGDIEDALDPQQRITVAVEQHRQPDAEPRPIDRLVEAERQSADVVRVAVMIVRRMASIAEAIRRLPVLHAFTVGRKQRVCIDIVFGATPERCARIDVVKAPSTCGIGLRRHIRMGSRVG